MASSTNNNNISFHELSYSLKYIKLKVSAAILKKDIRYLYKVLIVDKTLKFLSVMTSSPDRVVSPVIAKIIT